MDFREFSAGSSEFNIYFFLMPGQEYL